VALLRRHRPLRRGDAGHLATRDLREAFSIAIVSPSVALMSRNWRILQEEQRDLPGGAAVAVGVVFGALQK
jgi:hypothetical protein